MRHHSKRDLAILSQQGLGATLPSPVQRKRRDNPEWRIQASVFKWWRGYCRTVNLPECLFFAVPNGSALGTGTAQWQKDQRAIRGRMLKLAGLVSGVADCFLATTKIQPGVRYYGLFLELKAPGGIVSDDQQVFRTAVVAQGYQHSVAYSAEEAVKIVTEYLT